MPEVSYSVELESPILLEQGRPNELACPVRRHGSLVVPSAGTIDIYDASNALVVDGEPITEAGGIATYTTDDFASSTRGMRWRIEWSLTLDGVARSFRTTAGLVRCVPSPVVSDLTIYGRVPVLEATHPSAITRAVTHQRAIDDAWKEIGRQLRRDANRPHLVVDQSDLEEPHLLLTLARIFGGLGVVKPEHLETAKRYEKDYELAWGEVVLEYDYGDDGRADTKKSASGSLWLCGR